VEAETREGDKKRCGKEEQGSNYKITKQIAPYLPEFKYNPKDARFIGSSIDLFLTVLTKEEAIK